MLSQLNSQVKQILLADVKRCLRMALLKELRVIFSFRKMAQGTDSHWISPLFFSAF